MIFWDYNKNKETARRKCIAVTRLVMVVLTSCGIAGATSYFVGGSNANNNNNGRSISTPFATIQKAADNLMPGDTCFVRSGVYREFVKPVRGGNGESSRITYAAYPNEMPIIKGSERITNWAIQSGTIYKSDVPNTLFGSYNPFSIHLTDPEDLCLKYGAEHVLGEVYVKSVAYKEALSQSEMNGKPSSWYVQVGTSVTSIWINYAGTSNPNLDTTEINVRESLFRPGVSGSCNYITVDGLGFKHGASQWATCCSRQTGMMDVWGGRSWIIQNCSFSDARCSAICSGNTGSGTSPGYHIVRNNKIERCGQAGIIGARGWHFSLVEKNLIQDINYKQEFGGWETAGMKTHQPIDLTIRNNVIRRVYGLPSTITSGDAWWSVHNGIWIDWTGQGVRISGNVFSEIDPTGGYRTVNSALKIEVCHGPVLIDNNIFVNCAVIESNSDNLVFAHNLFKNLRTYHSGDSRSTPYYVPHTTTRVGNQTCNLSGYHVYNNILSGLLDGSWPAGEYNYNVYYGGQTKMGSEPNSVVEAAFNSNLVKVDLYNGARISLNASSAMLAMQTPLITNAFIGTLPPSGQGIENPDGTPITVNKDILNNSRNTTHPIAGPFETLALGANTFTITAGPKELATTPIRSAFVSPAKTAGNYRVFINSPANDVKTFIGLPGAYVSIYAINGKKIASYVVSSKGEYAISMKNVQAPHGVFIVK